VNIIKAIDDVQHRRKGVLRKIVVTDMYKALPIHKIRQNTKMPTYYKTLYLLYHGRAIRSMDYIYLRAKRYL
jgi:hypothetical protein